jgi:hypothetical protein
VFSHEVASFCNSWHGRDPDAACTKCSSAACIAHYRTIVIALNETIRLMREVDETIEAHVGRPGGFVMKAAKV